MYVILTQPTLADAIADLSHYKYRMLINAQRAVQTAMFLQGQAPDHISSEPELIISAFLWRGHSIMLLEYASMMIDRQGGKYMRGYGPDQIDHMLDLLVDDDREPMHLPPWSRRADCLDAMRAYLAATQSNPFPPGKGLEAYV